MVDSNDFSFAPGSTVDGDIYIIDTSRNNLILREFDIKLPFGTPRSDTTKFEFTTRLTATLDPDNDPNNPIYTNLAIVFAPTNGILYYRNIYYLNPKDYPEYDPNTLNDQDYGDLLTYNKRDNPNVSYTITNVRGESVSSIIEFSDLRRYNELDRQEDQANRIPPTPKITNKRELRRLKK